MDTDEGREGEVAKRGSTRRRNAVDAMRLCRNQPGDDHGSDIQKTILVLITSPLGECIISIHITVVTIELASDQITV